MNTEDQSDFLEVGSLQVFEARRILPRLDEARIRFRVEGNDEGIKKMDGVTAAYGGSWGNAASIRLFIQQEDGKKAGKILGEFFKV